MLGGISTPASAAEINIIPIPVKTQVQKGEFVLPQKVVIAYQTAEGRNIAQYMADKLKASTGYEVTVGGKKGNISIQISPSLKIAEEGVSLASVAPSSDRLAGERCRSRIRTTGRTSRFPISTRRLTDWRSMSASIVFSTMTVPERKLSKDLQTSIPTVSVTHPILTRTVKT